MEPQSESPISNERWLSAKLQAIRDALVAPDAEDIEAIDELAVTLLSTVTAGRNAVMFFMAKQDQPGNVSALIAAIARVALGLSVATVPVDPALSGAEFADRLFNRSLGFIASPTKDSSLETFPPASPNTPNSAGADSRYLSATSLKTSPVSPRSIFFDRSPTSPRRNQPPSGARPSLVPGISRKYSVGVASGRKLPGVVILENFQAASKDIQGFVADMLVKRQVADRYQVHNLPRPFLMVATVPAQTPHRKLGLPQHLIDLFFLSNSLYSPVPRPLVVNDGLPPLISADELDQLQRRCENVVLHHDLARYIWDLVISARQHALVFTPPSTRARNDLTIASRAIAALFGSDFVTASHIQLVFDKALSHRLSLTTSRTLPPIERSNLKGPTPSDVCSDCLDVAVPL